MKQLKKPTLEHFRELMKNGTFHYRYEDQTVNTFAFGASRIASIYGFTTDELLEMNTDELAEFLRMADKEQRATPTVAPRTYYTYRNGLGHLLNYVRFLNSNDFISMSRKKHDYPLSDNDFNSDSILPEHPEEQDYRFLDKNRTPVQHIEDWDREVQEITTKLYEIESMKVALNEEAKELETKKVDVVSKIDKLSRLIKN